MSLRIVVLRSSLFAAAILLGAAACGGDDSTGGTVSPDASTPSDGSTGRHDSSMPPGDAGGTMDSGGSRDAGPDSGGTDSGGTDSGATDSGGVDSGGMDSGGTDSGATDSGGVDSGTDSGATDSGSDTGAPDSGTDSGGAVDAGVDSGAIFPPGTICNASSNTLTPPARIKHLIVILFENENFGQVNGQASAPYINSLASQCGIATAYEDNCFTDNLVSLPHYLALTSGSNCNTGLDQTGTGCITDDNDATSHTLSTTSIFQQAASWKSYQESMPSACDMSSNGQYAAKHNPAAYYTGLSTCSTDDVSIAAVTCNLFATNTACTPAPNNAFTQDLADDTLAEFTFITPNLVNDMHDGTVTEADNWLYTYMPLVFQSPAYLRGEVAVQLLWDEQETFQSGGPTPNVFISPYIKAGTSSATPMNHFAMLRAWENALGITTYLGCASGTQPGGGSCPAGSTADVRAALNW